MWYEAIERTRLRQNGVHIDVVSIESLSYRQQPPIPHYDLVVVDEAHHARNRATKRYATLAMICSRAQVLLMSATPIHNTYDDLTALLALFLEHRAYTLADHELARLLIRRTHTQGSITPPIPTIHTAKWRRLPLSTKILDSLLTLPPPLPPRNAGSAHHFVTLTLLRQWISSDASLHTALQRRIARARAMLDAIAIGRYPTAQELRAWVYNDHTSQLAFTELLLQPSQDPTVDLSTLAPTLRIHLAALIQLVQQVPRPSRRDIVHADYIRTIRNKHPGEKIVAFSQYTETVDALFHALVHDGFVASLTSRAGRIASGQLSRHEILTRFAPHAHNTSPPARRDTIDLLLATDLLSEGVNLHDASVVIHLDLPWTNAILEQRVGRVARLGSRHSCVTVYGFLPSRAADAALRTTTILCHKHHLTHLALGDSPIPHTLPTLQETSARAHTNTSRLIHQPSSSHQLSNPIPHTSLPEHTEAIRTYLLHWLSWRPDNLAAPSHCSTHSNTPNHLPEPQQLQSQEFPCLVSTIPSRSPTFLAACIVDNTPTLLTLTRTNNATTSISHINHTVRAIHQSLNTPQLHHTLAPSLDSHATLAISRSLIHAQDTITRWYNEHHAAADAGLTTLLANQRTDTRTKRATLRHLDTNVASAPWNRRAELAQAASHARQTIQQRLPKHGERPFTDIRVIALLLGVPPD
jgi:hypothetical protein